MGMIYNFARLPFFEAWLGFSGAIPDIYWNTWSEEQRYKWLCRRLQMLVEYSNELGAHINDSQDAIEDLARQLAEMQSPEYWEEAFKNIATEWINENMSYIYKQTIKQIYFALDDKGRLIAFIPESWRDINFYTPMNYADQDTYGHLQILLNDVVVVAEETDQKGF